MAEYGYLLCDGCDDCRTSTVAADPDVHDWPCCEHFPENKAPCRYAVIARCTSYVALGPGYPNDWMTDTTTWVLHWAVSELRKHCFVGCEWGWRPTSAAMAGGDDYSGMLIDITDDALNPSFPPSHVTAGALGYHDADYRTDAPCLAPNRCFGDFDPDCVNDLFDRWTLSASGTVAGAVTYTLTDPNILAWAADIGKTIPVYENVADWEPFGRNRMDIVAGYDDFPMLPKSICVVALDEPGAQANPCEDQDSRCACNDFNFNNSVTLLVKVVGCDSISGLQTVTMTRYYPPTTLPCGVSYPTTHPCGVFIGSMSTGDGCESDGVSWSGGVLLMLWCDPTGDGTARYKMKVFCWSNDSSCYVEQGEASITRLDLLCWGVIYLEFTLPALDCCCPETPVDTCCCPDDPTPFTVTADDGTNTVVLTWNGTTAWDGTGDMCGCTNTGVHMQCLDIGGGLCGFDLVVDCLAPGTQPTLTTSTCNPFSATFSNGLGCDVTVT